MTGRSGRTKTGKRDPYPEKHIRKNRTDTETSTDTKTDTETSTDTKTDTKTDKTDKTTMKRNTGYRMKNKKEERTE